MIDTPNLTPTTSNKSILLVEDEEPMARAVQIKLEQSGFKVTVALDGQEALDALATNTYDLILLDIMMPKVDGWEVLKQINDRKLKTKVIVTSNLSQEEDIEKAKSLGVADFLVKSDVTLSQLAEFVAGAVG